MTAVRARRMPGIDVPPVVVCDADARTCPSMVTGPNNLPAVRVRADDLGWRIAIPAGPRLLDYCPTHAYRAEAS